MNVRLTFGEWLGDQLSARKMRAAGLGRLVGMGRNTAGSWLKDEHVPHQRTCRDIARVLGLDVNEVLVRAGYPPETPGYVLPEDREPEPDDNPLDISEDLRFGLIQRGMTPEQADRMVQTIEDIVRGNRARES